MIQRLALNFFCFNFALAGKVDYTNHQVWSVCSPDGEDKELFQRSIQNLCDKHLNVEIWKTHENQADMMVSGDKIVDVKLALDKMGLDFKVVIESLGKLIEAEEEEIGAAERSAGFNVEQYHTLEEIYEFLHKLSEKHDFLSIDSIGKTFEGRDMLVTRICVDGCGHKQVMWIDSGIHAREWIGPASNLYMLNKLIDKVSKGEDMELLKVDWYIMPVLNPDGYVHTWTTDRMWRKTRHIISGSGDCVGVDLNRNFDFTWGESRSSDDPCKETYRGPKPFSEPELINLKNYLTVTLGGSSQVVYYMNLHCFAQHIMYPYGGIARPSSDAKDLEYVAGKAYNALKSVRGTQYEIGPIYSTMSQTSGMAVDWVYSVAGVKYSYIMELPPAEESQIKFKTGFILPAKNIKPVGEELFAFHESVARDMVKEFVMTIQ